MNFFSLNKLFAKRVKRITAERENTTLRIVITIAFLFFLGLLLLWWASLENYLPESKWPGSWNIFASSVGSAFLTSSLLVLGFDLIARRAFAEELFITAGIAINLRSAGLKEVIPYFQSEEIKWNRLFEATIVTVFFLGSATWTNQFFADIQKLCHRKDAQLTILLPNPLSSSVMKEVNNRFQYSVSISKNMIINARNQFKEFAKDPKTLAKVSVRYSDKVPQLSLFKFDGTIVAAFYTYQKIRTHIPTLIVERPGILFKFFADELEYILSNSTET